MMKAIIGKKIEMSQIFKQDGTVVPVTLVQAGPCTVTQIKTSEKDGYNSVQLGFGLGKHLPKPSAGHLKDLPMHSVLHDFDLQADGIKRGDVIDVSAFTPGEKVTIIGISKGRGFQGVVKRHGFHGAPASHGTKDQLRASGSIGPKGPERVFKGVRMAGRMGGDRVTVKNLEVVSVDKNKNIIALKGAVPGARNSFIYIRTSGNDIWQK
ncbi:TPA: 50S ribosomal protein L3 [Candidatus Uhrbacteria bacterium]|nr:50S ribosomal protein L3 [Candidatus Uhrbacteria bacterium]